MIAPTMAEICWSVPHAWALARAERPSLALPGASGTSKA